MDDVTKMMTVQEVADLLQVGLSTVYTWVREGSLVAVRLGRVIRFDPEDVRAFIEKARLSA